LIIHFTSKIKKGKGDIMLNDSEKLLVEAINTMLQHDAKLGLSVHDNDESNHVSEIERGFQHLHGHITEMFALKAAESPFHDSLCQAFGKVHNYKYIDDPTFRIAMEKELLAQGIPLKERNKALDIVPAIVDDLKSDEEAWSEQNFGFNTELDRESIFGSTTNNDFNIE